MIPSSQQLRNTLGAQATTFCTCWKVTRTDATVLGFTDHDRDLIIDGVTYLAASGYQRTDIAGSDDLSVDNLELDGVLTAPSITEADLHAGLWDFAAIQVFEVNWSDYEFSYPISGITRASTLATATTPTAHGLQIGYQVLIAGANEGAYNGLVTITATLTPTTFRYNVAGSPATPATGTITYQTRTGSLPLRSGTIGEVTVERDVFKAEQRGLTQAYTRTVGELTQPGCRAELYDARCKVDPTAFTVTGTLTGVSPNGLTLYDSARAEPGPPGGVVIQTISKANPGVVHLANGAGASFSNGEAIMFSAITGSAGIQWAELNTTTIIRNLSGDFFDLGIDTSGYTGTYNANSGVCTPLGSNSGYFDFGLITMTSGAANGLSMEVRSYVPGQWTLELPFPYLPAAGDSYSMRAGCDKSLATCIAKFNNVLNFRGEPYLPGLDKMVQTGKQF